MSSDDIQPALRHDVGTVYAQLALRIEQHLPGYIDAYFGPANWKAQAEAEGKQSLDTLAAQAHELMCAAQQALFDSQRQRFLVKQVSAMRMTLRILAGESVPFVEEVQGLYDVTAERVDEAQFENALRELGELLPGKGAINERLRARRKQFDVPRERVLELFQLAKAETRRRSRALFALPSDEDVEITLVNDKPWGAYNWYRGGHRSLIEVNTDSPVQANGLVGLMAHEGYPGHHTEHAVKEQLLLEQNGWREACVQLINAPACVIAEGIATSAADVIFADGEFEAWQREYLYPRAGVRDDLPPDVVQRIHDISRLLGGVSGNAALLLHVEGKADDDVIAYLLRYSSRSTDEAQRYIRFLKSPVFRSYSFTYSVGHDLLAQLFERHDKVEVFKRVLSEPLTPTDLRGWLSNA